MFYTIYKLYQLVYIIKKFANIYNDITLVNEEYCHDLKESILNAGCIGIKFSQWILSKMRSEPTKNCSFAIDYFEDLFDNCPTHDWEIAKKIFYKTYKMNMDSIVKEDTIELIASGSIGQIYYAELITPYVFEYFKIDTKTNKIRIHKKIINEVAIKIKHPNVNSEASIYSSIFRFLSYIQKNQHIKKNFHLHFDFNDFIDNIIQQIDLNNEMFNSNIIRKNFENNDCVYIPKVLFSSENVLISEYIKGEEFEDLTDYNQLKVSLNYIAIINKMCIVDNFVHGDLHHKNWKPLSMSDGDNNIKNYKIILYDLGICFKSEDKTFLRDLFDVFESGNIEGLSKVVMRGIIKPENSTLSEDDIRDLVVNTVDTFQKKALDVINVTNNLNDALAKHNLKLSSSALNLCVMFTLIDHTLKKQNIVGGNVEPNHYYNVLKAKQLDLIAYCRVNNAYSDLIEYLEDKVKRHSEMNKDHLQIFVKRSKDSYLSLDAPSDTDSDTDSNTDSDTDLE